VVWCQTRDDLYNYDNLTMSTSDLMLSACVLSLESLVVCWHSMLACCKSLSSTFRFHSSVLGYQPKDRSGYDDGEEAKFDGDGIEHPLCPVKPISLLYPAGM
jgi:hypothetical protein